MTQLDDQTRELLCSLDQPPPGAQERVLASLLGTIGGGGGGGGGDFSPPTASGTTGASSSYAAKIVGATLGLTAAGFALVVAGSAPLRSQSRATAPARAPTERSEPTVAIEPRPQTAPIAAVTPTPAPAPSSAESPAAPRREPTTKPIAAAPTATLEAELALLDTARRGSPTEALAALEQHREQFPAGALADEREVMRVESLCALGRSNDARASAREFLAAHPSSPLRSRIRASCVGAPN